MAKRDKPQNFQRSDWGLARGGCGGPCKLLAVVSAPGPDQAILVGDGGEKAAADDLLAPRQPLDQLQEDHILVYTSLDKFGTHAPMRQQATLNPP
eukprot:1180023-Rhodomonas_salina.1